MDPKDGDSNGDTDDLLMGFGGILCCSNAMKLTGDQYITGKDSG